MILILQVNLNQENSLIWQISHSQSIVLPPNSVIFLLTPIEANYLTISDFLIPGIEKFEWPIACYWAKGWEIFWIELASKNNLTQAGGMTRRAECLANMHKALSSTPALPKKKIIYVSLSYSSWFSTWDIHSLGISKVFQSYKIEVWRSHTGG
jgi:hypothetical protein